MIKGDEEDNKGLSKGTFTFKLETKITTKNTEHSLLGIAALICTNKKI